MFEQEFYGAYFCTVWCFQHILVAYLVQTQRNIVPRGKKSLVSSIQLTIPSLLPAGTQNILDGFTLIIRHCINVK